MINKKVKKWKQKLKMIKCRLSNSLNRNNKIINNNDQIYFLKIVNNIIQTLFDFIVVYNLVFYLIKKLKIIIIKLKYNFIIC